MPQLHESAVFSELCRHNPRISSPVSVSDDYQHVTVTAFILRKIKVYDRISIGAVLTSLDGKLILCHRRRSFLFTEIRNSRNVYRQQRLFRMHSKYLGVRERTLLSEELSIESTFKNDHVDLIFPGGAPKSMENVIDCLFREIKEETNIDKKYINIDNKQFFHVYISDKMIDKQFDTILFVGNVLLTSDQITTQFVANREVNNISLIDINKLGNELPCKIASLATALLTATLPQIREYIY